MFTCNVCVVIHPATPLLLKPVVPIAQPPSQHNTHRQRSAMHNTTTRIISASPAGTRCWCQPMITLLNTIITFGSAPHHHFTTPNKRRQSRLQIINNSSYIFTNYRWCNKLIYKGFWGDDTLPLHNLLEGKSKWREVNNNNK